MRRTPTQTGARAWRAAIPLALALSAVVGVGSTLAATGTYRNPILPEGTAENPVPGNGLVESCADPSVIRGQEQEDDHLWYMYCTTDPLNDDDRNATGDFVFHLVPMFSSPDLVNWTYEGDAFTTRPAYAAPNVGLWAPEIAYFPETDLYHLYYTVVDTVVTATNPTGPGSAIGVATSDSPLGPWTHHAAPVVEPHAADCCPGSRRWVFDPEIEQTAGPDYIYYGSYFGGISVRELTANGLDSNPATQTNVAVANKFEGAEVVFKDGFYYLFVSATDCCRGPLTGYVVLVGRSTSPTGPFRDRDGVDLNDNEGPPEADPTNARVGGTPVIYQNGNRWVGTGHNTVLVDEDGQWWTIYHAVDVTDPYFEGAVGFTKRPALLDAIDWDAAGWPLLNGGSGPSDTPQHAPAAQPGQTTNHQFKAAARDRTSALLFRDEFNDSSISPAWTWVRAPAATEGRGTLNFPTQALDLHESSNNASVLTTAAPKGNYVVETKVRINLPAEGCCFNFTQAGLVVYENDDNYVKLVHVSIFNTRQTEFAKEVGPVPAGFPRYGNTIVGPPNETTWLRIVKRTSGSHTVGGTYGGKELYTAYTSRDGVSWVRGGTWAHDLGANARIGLVSMGGAGFQANFDYVRVYRATR